MAITSIDNYIASTKQRIGWIKTAAARTTVANIPFTLFDLAGNPGSGTLAGTTTASAIVQDDTVAGYPWIQFTSGLTYLSKVEYGNSIACRFRLVDVLSKGGAYSYATGTTTITSYPDISGRCPDYTTAGAAWGTRNEIWVECVTAFTSATAWQVQVTYTNQSGATSRSTIISPAQAAAALTVGKMFQLALQAGDTGIQKLQSVIVTNAGAVAGSFNLLIVRELWTGGRVRTANDGDVHDMLKTGMPLIYNTSAILPIIQTDSTVSGQFPEIFIELANNGT
jgi:hypothetical protein